MARITDEEQKLAYEEGYAAGEVGIHEDDCPYGANTVLGMQWRAGWSIGIQKYEHEQRMLESDNY
ncbi:hypothetical protein FW320_05530 [Azospirillum sp. Vi22]|uniref:ribosome modulation factor n=1 Tax=Azospirillum baldaniorum TaxID=1064539 RepID=UPI00157A5409|nr:hypothetical protein [Azospirillum baldaniorum]NUB05639.1 hypothetical protein [Azospirillum baldaniorum]